MVLGRKVLSAQRGPCLVGYMSGKDVPQSRVICSPTSIFNSVRILRIIIPESYNVDF